MESEKKITPVPSGKFSSYGIKAGKVMQSKEQITTSDGHQSYITLRLKRVE